jgi:plasminogen activator inhibitor 1 RNA-binding protein
LFQIHSNFPSCSEHDKQAAHGWGGQTGGDEWADEKAGEAIAKDEEKTEAVVNSGEAWDADAQPADPFAKEATDAEEEPEDKTKSYTAWLAEQAEKKLSLGSIDVRKPNEGSTKKFPEGKPLSKEEEEAYMAGSGGKAKRERQRKEKTIVELDNERLHKEPADSGFRGGRGGRGGRGRGEGRGRGGRGRGEGRGDGGFRGGRGGRGGQGANAVNLADTSAFPSLGS